MTEHHCNNRGQSFLADRI